MIWGGRFRKEYKFIFDVLPKELVQPLQKPLKVSFYKFSGILKACCKNTVVKVEILGLNVNSFPYWPRNLLAGGGGNG